MRFVSSLVGVTAIGAQAVIKPDPSTSFGEWEGWGVSLSWFANVFGGRQDIADALYGLDNATVALNGTTPAVQLPGLGFNIARYNVGGTAYETVNGQNVVLSPNFPKWKQIQGFQPTPGQYNWDLDANQIAFTKAAMTAGADTLELFSNSPMWWMLLNFNPSGSNDGASDNLSPKYYQAHAQYMAAVAAGLEKNHGLKFATVEAFNEPVANWWKSTGNQEGCHFDYSTQATVLPLLRQALDSAGLTDTLIASSDESLTDQALPGWLSFNASVRGVIDRFNLHGYQGTAGNRSGVYEEVRVRGGKTIRMSEHGESDNTGATLATTLALDLTFLHPQSWVYWQALDSYNWGLLNSEVGSGLISGVETKWFVLAQYTRHIRAGDVLIAANDAASSTVVAYSAARGTATVVAFNPSAKAPLPLTVDLSRFASAAGPVEAWVTGATADPGAPQYAYLGSSPISGQAFSATLPPLSVQTFVVHGVAM